MSAPGSLVYSSVLFKYGPQLVSQQSCICLLQERWFQDPRSEALIAVMKQLPIFTAGSLPAVDTAQPMTTQSRGMTALLFSPAA